MTEETSKESGAAKGASAQNAMRARLSALGAGLQGALMAADARLSARLARFFGQNSKTDGGGAGDMTKTSEAAPKQKRAARARPPSAPRPLWRHPLIVETASVFSSLAFIGVAALLFAAFVLIAPQVDDGADLWAVNRPASVVILDRNGEELAARGARYGQAVSVDDLPPYLIKAVVSTEDRRFFDHGGVDLRGTLRALFVNLSSGNVREGGSTITQQLARNLFLSQQQTYVRKAKEALLALWLEGRYTKNQILSLYLNRIYFGAGAYGIEAAARTYFGKSARDVSLAEAVMLAGLPKAPSQLAPTENPFGAQNRANQVLGNLLETGAVTEFEAREARLNPPVIAGGNSDAELGYVFDYIAGAARKIAGERRGDLIITTTLDRKMQRDAQAAIKAGLGVDTLAAGAEQAAIVVFDVNGALRAMVGGRSYVESQFNRAVQARRQPGSAFKPFVYAAALEAGVTPQTIFIDQPVEVEGWSPSNYTPGYLGRMRVSEAVARSTNTIAVQVSEMVGRRKVVAMANRLGIRSEIMAVPSIALGGVSVTLDELTAAYLPFANGGLSASPYAILSIEDQNFETLYQHKDGRRNRVLATEVARDMNHLLFQVMNSGTGVTASLGARIAAGKTGTTNDWRDAWFVGYTSQLVAGVWVGNDTYQPMKKVTGGQVPARIWKSFMTAAHQNMPRLPLDGAYPAPTYGDESQLLGYYADLARAFRDVRRDGDEGRRERRRGRR